MSAERKGIRQPAFAQEGTVPKPANTVYLKYFSMWDTHEIYGVYATPEAAMKGEQVDRWGHRRDGEIVAYKAKTGAYEETGLRIRPMEVQCAE